MFVNQHPELKHGFQLFHHRIYLLKRHVLWITAEEVGKGHTHSHIVWIIKYDPLTKGITSVIHFHFFLFARRSSLKVNKPAARQQGDGSNCHLPIQLSNLYMLSEARIVLNQERQSCDVFKKKIKGHLVSIFKISNIDEQTVISYF